MNANAVQISVGKLILVPAIVTLAVTLLRLFGELQRWSPLLFSREAGGAGALIGIVWLVPVFGVYFALKLSAGGHGPESRGKAIGLAAAGLVAYVLVAAAAGMASESIVVQVIFFNLAAAVGAVVAYRGWPALGRTQLAYGFSARVPVAIVMLAALIGNWGTHYELGAPGMPELSLFPKWLLIGLLPQMVFWVGFTVVVGMLFGGLAILFRRNA